MSLISVQPHSLEYSSLLQCLNNFKHFSWSLWFQYKSMVFRRVSDLFLHPFFFNVFSDILLICRSFNIIMYSISRIGPSWRVQQRWLLYFCLLFSFFSPFLLSSFSLIHICFVPFIDLFLQYFYFDLFSFFFSTVFGIPQWKCLSLTFPSKHFQIILHFEFQISNFIL